MNSQCISGLFVVFLIDGEFENMTETYQSVFRIDGVPILPPVVSALHQSIVFSKFEMLLVY